MYAINVFLFFLLNCHLIFMLDVSRVHNSVVCGCSAEVVKTVVMKGKAPVDSECTAKLGKVK